ncbi:hypothetical protein D9M68_882420 [compost metagenome]
MQVARQPLGLRQQFAVAELLIEEHQSRLVRVTLRAHHQVVPERGHGRTDAVRQALRPEAVVGAQLNMNGHRGGVCEAHRFVSWYFFSARAYGAALQKEKQPCRAWDHWRAWRVARNVLVPKHGF